MMQNNNDGRFQSPRSRWLVIFLVILAIIVPLVLIAQSGHKSSQLPKADQEHGPTFEGMRSFIDNGLTTDQVNGIIKAFSKFSPKAQNIVINTNSLSPGPHDPNRDDPFTINFDVSVDSTAYKGVVSYSDLTSIQLILSDVNGKQVFDSGVVTAGT